MQRFIGACGNDSCSCRPCSYLTRRAFCALKPARGELLWKAENTTRTPDKLLLGCCALVAAGSPARCGCRTARIESKPSILLFRQQRQYANTKRGTQAQATSSYTTLEASIKHGLGVIRCLSWRKMSASALDKANVSVERSTMFSPDVSCNVCSLAYIPEGSNARSALTRRIHAPTARLYGCHRRHRHATHTHTGKTRHMSPSNRQVSLCNAPNTVVNPYARAGLSKARDGQDAPTPRAAPRAHVEVVVGEPATPHVDGDASINQRNGKTTFRLGQAWLSATA